MSKRLQDNLTSHYIASANRLQPKNARQRIVAYVESYDDVFFWRSVLQDFETDKFYFEVMLPSRTTLGKGKKTTLMNQLGKGLGEYMIACVDADYDWLLQGRTEVSKYICNCPYVMHTYVYAIENFQCYAPSLHSTCVMSTLNDRPLVDFEQFMTEYSLIIWPLFVWNIWAYRYNHYKEFPMGNFCDIVSFHNINPRNVEPTLDKVRRRVNKCMGWLQRTFPEGHKTYPLLKAELQEMGIKPENCYLYMHGHTLFENVVMTLLTPVCNILRREREREINELAVHETQKQNELASYRHSQMPVDQMLRKSTGFKSSPQYQLLKEDIMRLTAEVGLEK
ncbi:MAG: DUF4435 domain-containing protein [Bacteroidaceae bacterium]|nr:DUF4435 domain-containing protein [Bacteroidaceae bacterium]